MPALQALHEPVPQEIKAKMKGMQRNNPERHSKLEFAVHLDGMRPNISFLSTSRHEYASSRTMSGRGLRHTRVLSGISPENELTFYPSHY